MWRKAKQLQTNCESHTYARWLSTRGAGPVRDTVTIRPGTVRHWVASRLHPTTRPGKKRGGQGRSEDPPRHVPRQRVDRLTTSSMMKTHGLQTQPNRSITPYLRTNPHSVQTRRPDGSGIDSHQVGELGSRRRLDDDDRHLSSDRFAKVVLRCTDLHRPACRQPRMCPGRRADQ